MIDISFGLVDDAMLNPRCKPNSKKSVTSRFDNFWEILIKLYLEKT